MKTAVTCLASALGMALGAGVPMHAQTVPASSMTVLPPPSINAPGAKPVPIKSAPKPAASATGASPAAASTAIPIPALPSMHESAPLDARGQPPPTVKVSKHNGQLVEEYYEGGQLYMVQVHPKHGVTYTYFVNKAHQLTRSPGAPPVDPTLYTILTWGGSDDSH